VARSRGVDWLYTYLKSFYLDGSRPFGVNNLVFKDVAMPAVLWHLQGWQKPVYTNVTEADGSQRQVVSGVELVEQGKLSPENYDKVVRDLVNFLAYMGEPAKLERQRVGVWVILFLLIFFVVSYLLKKEYWKDVH
jgi:ubiquinol-cytochrome c reductase cytochrome c1 subunit